MSESETATAETESLGRLRDLNANYIRGFAESDLAWHREHLAEGFVCTLADGRRIDKATFLELNAQGSGVTEIDYELVEIKLRQSEGRSLSRPGCRLRRPSRRLRAGVRAGRATTPRWVL